MPRGEHPNSRAALVPFQRKRGDPPLNTTGRNQWSALRERARDRLTTDLDELLDVLFDRARRGDVTALRLALGSILDIKAHQFIDDDGASMSFADLARKARDSTA
jgi:hypothetical protein